MREDALKRLQNDGAIASYEVLDQDSDGNIIEYKIKNYTVKKSWYAGLLAAAYDKAQRATWVSSRT